jgi:hypothetical protein
VSSTGLLSQRAEPLLFQILKKREKKNSKLLFLRESPHFTRRQLDMQPWLKLSPTLGLAVGRRAPVLASPALWCCRKLLLMGYLGKALSSILLF